MSEDMAQMPADYGNGNKFRWIGGTISAAIIVGLVAWNFSAVQSLQVAQSKDEQQIAALRADLDFLRQSDINFQAETRTSLAAAQVEMRTNMGHITELITDVRIQLSDITKGVKH